MLDQDTINKFNKALGIDLVELIQEYIDFNETYKSYIVDYYSGNISKPNSTAFNILTNLIKEVNIVIDLISINKEAFNNYNDWNILEMLEKIYTDLLNINNLSKILRSAITINSYTSDPEFEIVLGQNQTLERLVKDKLGSSNAQDDWVDIALRNNLNEEDYTSQGGNIIKASLLNNSSIFINSAFDNIVGKKIYGLDLKKTLTFEGDDLKVLNYDQTYFQTIYILLSLRQEDNPEFPTLGINSRLIVGSNLGSITYPSLFRQIYNTFATDDSLKSISITKITQIIDAIELGIAVESKLGEIANLQINL